MRILEQYASIIATKYGSILALLSFLFYFTYFPSLLSIIWPNLYPLLPQGPLFISIMTFLNLAIMLVYSIAMYFIYIKKWQFFQQFRISKEAWPWEKDYKQWRQLLKRSIRQILLNIALINPIIMAIDISINSLHVKMKIQDLPQSNWTYLWQFFFFLFFEEIWIYFMHYLLHLPKLYWIHKPHHQYNVVVSISGQYVHPIQFIISSAFSASLGYKILMKFYPVHVFSLIIWLSFRVIEINDSHTGYNFPWFQSRVIPGNCSDDYHFFHHKQNLGNYSGITHFMDTLMGTNREYRNRIKGKNK